VAYPAPTYPPPVSGTPATAPLPVPHAPPPASFGGYGAAVSGAGAYGYDPVTGLPYSDKSKIVAGLLQLLPGFVLTLGGIGRLYAGNTGVGVAQIVASLIAWISFWCGLFLFFTTWIVWGGIWVWFVIDGIVMMAGRPVDGQGRPLRA
jgi:TM2 domain-containing membrane protein YozV